MRSAASLRSASDGFTVVFFASGIFLSGVKSNVVLSAVASLRISMRTGPGLPLFAMRNASRNVSARSSAFLTRKLCFVIGIVTPFISIS